MTRSFFSVLRAGSGTAARYLSTALEPWSPETARVLRLWEIADFFEIFLGGLSIVDFASDLPMVAEGIDDAAYAPTVLLRHRGDLRGACLQRALEEGIGIGHGEDHADGAATERFRAEIFVLRRLVTEPKFRAVYGESGYHAAAGVFETEGFAGSEGGFVEFDGLSAVANGEPRRDRGY